MVRYICWYVFYYSGIFVVLLFQHPEVISNHLHWRKNVLPKLQYKTPSSLINFISIFSQGPFNFLVFIFTPKDVSHSCICEVILTCTFFPGFQWSLTLRPKTDQKWSKTVIFSPENSPPEYTLFLFHIEKDISFHVYTRLIWPVHFFQDWSSSRSCFLEFQWSLISRQWIDSMIQRERPSLLMSTNKIYNNIN